MSWGIAETASEIEKIKSESGDYLNGLNSCGVIDWNTYSYAFDFYGDLLMKAYEQGKKDAQPERKKGMWIPVTNGRGGFECDQCHNYAPSYQDGVEWLSGFCPNCGAEMREPEDIPMEYFESGGR